MTEGNPETEAASTTTHVDSHAPTDTPAETVPAEYLTADAGLVGDTIELTDPDRGHTFDT